eukprot:m.282373 g.282373  ORF g.282373 m.282373 type:complete len:429 (+) comp17747_c1_seq6:284-1570(+)
MSQRKENEPTIEHRGLRHRHLPSTPKLDKPSASPLSTPSDSSDNGTQSSGLKARLTGISHVLHAYSPSRIIAEEKAQHQVKGKLDVVSKGDVIALNYLDDDGNTGTLLPQELCAISIVIYSEPHRKDIEGQIMLVKRAHSLSRTEWATWVRTFFLCLSNYFFLTLLVGPITAALLLFVVIAFRKDIDAWILSEFEMEHDTLVESKAWTGFFGLWINVMLPAFAHGYGAFAFWLVVSALAMLLFSKPILSLFTVPEHFRYIQPTYPVVISFRSQARMPELLSTRAKLVAAPRLVKKISHLSVGSYWAETVMSVLVYHDVYNSRRARRLMHTFLTYVLPMIFAFQLLYTLWPHFSRTRARFLRSVRADYGVVMGDRIVRSFRAVLRWPALPVVLQDAIDFVGDMTNWLTAWTAYITSFIVPIDEAYTTVH